VADDLSAPVDLEDACIDGLIDRDAAPGGIVRVSEKGRELLRCGRS